MPADVLAGRLRLAAALAKEVRAQRTSLRKLEDRLFAILAAELPDGSGAPPGASVGGGGRDQPPAPLAELPPSHPSQLVPRVSAIGSDPDRLAPQDSCLVEALIDLTRPGERPANRDGIVAAPVRGQTLADAVVSTDFDAGRREAEWALGGPPSAQTGQAEAVSRFTQYEQS